MTSNSRFFNGVAAMVGHTPLVMVDGIYAKVETTNPSGSVKDRMAWFVTKQAEERGELKKGMEIIELTSGNTGIAFALISAVKGYKFTAVMPESVSMERRGMIKSFGGKLVLTPAEEDMEGAKRKYEEIIKGKKNVWLPRQFENPDNPLSHELEFGAELVEDIPERIDAFVAGAGTGGTVIGAARTLRKVNPKARIVCVEPAESAVISGGKSGRHDIEGIGEGFIPPIIKRNRKLITDVMAIKTEDAKKAADYLALKHGFLVGTSSGANFLAAKRIKKKYGLKCVVTLFPDRGERYLSNKFKECL